MFKVLSATIIFLAIKLASFAQPVIEHYNFADSLTSAYRVKNKLCGSHKSRGVVVFDMDADTTYHFKSTNSDFPNLRVFNMESDFDNNVWISFAGYHAGHGVVKFDGSSFQKIFPSFFGLEDNIPNDYFSVLDITHDSIFVVKDKDFIYKWKDGQRSLVFDKMVDYPDNELVYTDSLFHYGPYFQNISILEEEDSTVLNTLLEFPLAICSDGNNGIYFGDPNLKHYDDGVKTTISTEVVINQNFPFFLNLELDNNHVLWGICIINQEHYLVKVFGNQMLDFVLLENLGFDVDDLDFEILDLTIDAFNNLVITHDKGVSLYNEHGVLGGVEHSLELNLEAYPNPSKKGFTIGLPINAQGSYVLVAANGRTVRKGEIQGDNLLLIDQQAPGVYFLKIELNGANQTLKLMQR